MAEDRIESLVSGVGGVYVFRGEAHGVSARDAPPDDYSGTNFAVAFPRELPDVPRVDIFCKNTTPGQNGRSGAPHFVELLVNTRGFRVQVQTAFESSRGSTPKNVFSFYWTATLFNN
jgi:hypothetical protein